ncbi:MAG: glutathione S-transferase family protein [Hyphomicrobiales bacterium]
MKLYYSPASPFVAKVLIVAHECDLAHKIECVDTKVVPGSPNLEYSAQNPLRQIPALMTDDGVMIYDSFAICDYLIRLADNETLLPVSGPERTKILNLHALCNGAAERAVQTRYETFVRPEQFRWPEMIDDNFGRIKGALALLEDNVKAFDGPFDISEAAFVALLRYLDLRFAEIDWRANYPKLVESFDSLNEMRCVQAAYA